MGASSTSSDVDEEEAERLRSVAVDSSCVTGVAAALSQHKKKKDSCIDDVAASSSLKFYQARARDHLHEYLDRTFDIEFVKNEECELPDVLTGEDADNMGFQLFRKAPSGFSDKKQHLQEAGYTKKKKLHNTSPNESSKMFQARLLASAIDGTSVASYAEKAKAKAFASWVLHQAEENKSNQKEEERIALLKLQRGEQWLPSVAKDMQLDSLEGRKSLMIWRKNAHQKFKKGKVKEQGFVCSLSTI